MCIVFTCGEHTFRKEIEGYEGVVCRCHNCGNYSGHPIKTHPWFTLCFVPVIPFSFHGYEDIACHVCNYSEPLDQRPDVLAMRHGGGGQVPMQPQGGYKPPPQGQYQGQQQGPPQPQPQQQPGQNGAMRYG
ncbi:hypothetical protein SPBR_06256 [Sporothrix brasiliensis 5110]|uniref:Rhodopsin family protein n=1 Tax=Sporothrix brasiliensis 5110 TaxID=1398154 RepID=A0A0C2IYV1_9PEZI|nr:uncharacterized protein SPBR_06256 [Sporothrix brasiliensis 5110]KIH94291.1 hypothetical protein SPBR_06256 [Sporothrix brasiliensis 5110]